MWCLCNFPQLKDIAPFSIVCHYNGRLVPINIGLDPFLKPRPKYGHHICRNYALVSWMKSMDRCDLLIPQTSLSGFTYLLNMLDSLFMLVVISSVFLLHPGTNSILKISDNIWMIPQYYKWFCSLNSKLWLSYCMWSPLINYTCRVILRGYLFSTLKLSALCS